MCLEVRVRLKTCHDAVVNPVCTVGKWTTFRPINKHINHSVFLQLKCILSSVEKAVKLHLDVVVVKL